MPDPRIILVPHGWGVFTLPPVDPDHPDMPLVLHAKAIIERDDFGEIEYVISPVDHPPIRIAYQG